MAALTTASTTRERTYSGSPLAISPYPLKTLHQVGATDTLEIYVETLGKLLEDHDYLPGNRKLLKAIVKVVNCLEQYPNPVGPEVMLHQTLTDAVKAIRAVKWYKLPFRMRTKKRDAIGVIRQAIWDYVEAKADSAYEGFDTNLNTRTSLRSLLNTSATSVSTTTFDAHIDLLGGQSDSDDDQSGKSDAEDNLEGLPWITDIRDFLRSDRPFRHIARVAPDNSDKVINFLQLECDKNREDTLYHARCIKCLFYMTRFHGILPTSFSCRHARRIGNRPIWGGGFADIWKGRMDDELICIKVLRVFMDNGIEQRNKMIKDFCREALVWRNLYHPSILPFLGVSRHLFAPSFCLISPWMEYGNIMTCLSERPHQIQRITAITQVAEGIAYLHGLNPPIVHADIRGANILVKDDLSCCLSDFGLALAVESHVGTTSSSRTFLGGSLRWMPPEIMDDKQFDPAYITARDVYSFGCTVIEIYTGKPPFSHIRKEAAIINEVLTHGSRPNKPLDIPDWLWELVSKCLVSPASRRLTAQKLVNVLTLGDNV
ncbi:kinase-like domain-containing protein [Desarmillaria tabescens]|uniref:Kinase-like domain-containing protein n=1 Tax=Armillaria tabescens TaxID=1929756 RepID=A0AA39JH73_ARMTA|nr:kinase-like domain-containing protein [Desarmillaria tabescens]KAK0442716.1 kinase-like domain-containing protein [Desarmillaria tabescens]